MKFLFAVLASVFILVSPDASGSDRINHEGRILGDLPIITNSILFNTSEADAIVAAMLIMPATNAWNENISHRPILPNSDAMIARIISDLSTNNRTLRVFKEMNFVVVPDNQPNVPISFVTYPGESDPGPYPIPTNMPVELWPSGTGVLTLEQWQRDVNNTGGDRHSIIVQPGTGFIWETWQAKLTNNNWIAANGAKFNLNTGALRPAGWTSADAAGLPMFPALVRFDECERGTIEHAVRIVVKRTRREYIYPATHFASTTPASETNVPAMGQRLRLKADFVIPTNWTGPEKALLTGLKKYGAIVADNGNFFSISITPDNRWSASAWSHISSISITNFEVIQTTGPNEGPRSPGAPTVNAGPDRWAPLNFPTVLEGQANAAPGAVVEWKKYSGPGTVMFSSSNQPITSAAFSEPGEYILMLSADDGEHAVAYDAVKISVVDKIRLTANQDGNSLALDWTGGSPPYVVERLIGPWNGMWNSVLTTAVQSVSFPMTNDQALFRVRED